MTDTKFQRYGALAGVAVVALFTASTYLTSGTGPLPGEGTGAEIAEYLRGNGGALKLQATLQTASVLALLFFVVLTASRLTAPFRQLAVAGGVLAAATTTVSAAVTAVMAQDAVIAEESLLPALQWLGFLTGGPGHALWFAPLLIGLGLGARRAGLLPGWLGVAGAVLGAMASLSVVSIAVFYASAAIPLGRYGSFLWILLAVPFLVRRSRNA
ncbi:hypothetical protein [Phytomonospora endophytica]|uniref:DUF4386 domain-containing protein n=1 Tax=Phytomonospora endophytica TaxID=714109 RepID=A0A841FVE0_9ACTN|nr:hypothetical protein [Phytomonospora endophytica]MBB6037307.1 hypothetical protein [Phytomonospora endophytica]GIG69949.1 hypothetical protein Pen01_62440 [Phytomonospora endophytica]